MKSERNRPLYIDDPSLCRAYSVEAVARIAAALPDPDLSSSERIEEALELLRAAEARALPSPWADQHLQPLDDGEEGDAFDPEVEERQRQRQLAVPQLIKASTENGLILRNRLALEASQWAKAGANQDEAEKRYLDWAKAASCSFHRWESMVSSGARHDDGQIDIAIYKAWEPSYSPPSSIDHLSFLSRFEQKEGRSTVLRGEDQARAVLLGGNGFEGLLKWLDTRRQTKRPVMIRSRKETTKGQFASRGTRGAGRGEDGTFESKDA